jgi:hypothetical protein
MAGFPPANTEAIAAIIQKSAPEIRLVVTKDYEENLARVVSGQTDAAALNFHVDAIIAARLYLGQLTPPRNSRRRAVSLVGQNEKASQRAFLDRCTPESGRSFERGERQLRATNGHC